MRPLGPAFDRALGVSTSGRALPEIRARLSTLESQLVTGRRVQRPSDDPAAFASARRLDALEARLTTFGEAASAARLWASRTAEELDGMADLALEAHTLGLQGANDTMSASDRAALADRIDTFAAQLVDRLNARSGDEYLFGGHRSTQPPFNPDGTAAAGIGGERRYRVGPDLELAANVDGERVAAYAGGGSTVGALRDLAAALRSGTAPPPEALDAVAAARDHFLGLGAEMGTTLNRFDTAEGQLDALGLDVMRRRSDLQDADYYQVAMALQQSRTQLEAALRTTASASQHTLLDYLR